MRDHRLIIATRRWLAARRALERWLSSGRPLASLRRRERAARAALRRELELAGLTVTA